MKNSNEITYELLKLFFRNDSLTLEEIQQHFSFRSIADALDVLESSHFVKREGERYQLHPNVPELVLEMINAYERMPKKLCSDIGIV
ncbi:hypothetical protein [Bacillus sp. AFS040349]|uniref:hypothetical protein n=1 Tax=Bacillus sp. AFS040349 TaxID=2033502 RepID=UPI000BFE4277|nr:hypothetical protein [Bacillus sp. AFS040349]PGT83274.1 hypothetical protein COD11_13140 [Bacillus sp. AFS040349]